MTTKLARIRFAVCLAAGVWSVWIVSQAAPALSGDASKGRPLYEKYCLLCHGPDGRGDGPLGLHMKPPAANFHKPESKHKSDAELFTTIQEGHSETAMASWKHALSDDQLRDILAYIRKLSPPAAGPTDRG